MTAHLEVESVSRLTDLLQVTLHQIGLHDPIAQNLALVSMYPIVGSINSLIGAHAHALAFPKAFTPLAGVLCLTPLYRRQHFFSHLPSH